MVRSGAAMHFRPRVLGLGLSGLVLVLGGCQAGPPPGTSSGRVPSGWSTPAEAGDARPLPDDYLSFVDTWCQALVRDMPHVPAFADLPYRATILFGDIYNRTDIVSSTEFEAIRKKMQVTLMQSETFNNNFRFLISRAHLDELRRREVNTPVEQQRFDENHTYLLNGTMYRISRSDTHLYMITYELVNFRTGESIFSRDYEGKRYGQY